MAGRTMRSGGRRPITIDDLAAFVLVSDPRVSPDGRQVLFTRQHFGEKIESVTNLWVAPVDGGDPRSFTSGGRDGQGRWSPDGARVAFVSSRADGGPQVFTIPADGGEATPLTNLPEGSFGAIVWSPDGTRLAVAFRETPAERTKQAARDREESGASDPPWVLEDLFYRLDGDGYFGAARHHLYVVDVETGEATCLFDRDTSGHFGFDWSPDSRELVVAANTHPRALEQPYRSELYRVTTKGRVRKIPGLPVGEKIVPRWSPNGEWIAFSVWHGKEVWAPTNGHLTVCRPDGSEVRDLSGGEDYCVQAAVMSDLGEVNFDATYCWSPDGERLFVQLGARGEQHVASIGIGGDERFTLHTKGRRVVTLGNVVGTDEGLRLGLLEGNPTRPNDVAVGRCNIAGKRFRTKALTGFNEDLLAKLDLAEPEPHWVDSTDGTKVHTWVLRPPASVGARKRRPCVIEVHGGPHAQYGEALFHEFQLLAAEGYVVVYSNPRGSKGYGEAHTTAIRGKWGAADWDDVQAVTDFAAGLPDVDAKRLGIMGGSYGGYMTNWAISHSDVYRAAITDRCVSNFVSMAGSSDFPLIPGGYWKGSPWDEPEELWAQSPIAHFANVKTPTLVIHSEGDLRCNVEQGEQVYTALKLLGVPTRFVRYPRSTSHGLSRCGPMDLRQHRLGEILRWWREHL